MRIAMVDRGTSRITPRRRVGQDGHASEANLKALERRKIKGYIALGFRQFSVRGQAKVSGEFSLVSMALNLRRMGNMIEWV